MSYWSVIALGIAFLIVVLGICLVIEHRVNVKRHKAQTNQLNSDVHGLNDRINQVDQETKQRLGQTRAELVIEQDKLLKEVTRAREYSETVGREIRNDFTKKLTILEQVLQKVVEDNKRLAEENSELRKKLAFYTEIEEDSGKINETEDIALREELLGKLSEELSSQMLDSDEENDAGEEHEEGTAFTEESKILDREQSNALSYMLNTRQNLFITGKAGTGKSFLLEAFVRQTHKKVLILAPTGIAALNVNGVTIHSALGYKNLETLNVDEISADSVLLKSEKRMVIKEADTIVIDEISMVRADTLDKISKILQVVSGNESLFGGKQMILFGDLFQLPPIAKGQEREYLMSRYGGVFFFFSEAYKQGNFRFIELSINHRQKGDSRFFEVLNRIREGATTKEDIEMLNDRRKNISDTQRILTLFPTKLEAERVNREQLDRIEGREYTYTAEIVLNKANALSASLESIFPITKDLKLKVGALVMMVANDAQGRWVNGTMGIVKKLETDKVFVAINECTYEVFKVKFTEKEAKYKDGKIAYEDTLAVEQYPVVLAYAITIHKSQGMTYKQLACDLSKCFAPGQAYVALSRCSSLEGLTLISDFQLSALQVDDDVRSFYSEHVS